MRNDRRYTVLFNILLIFAVLMPISKSANSLVMGLIYVYCLFFVVRHREARTDIYRWFRQPLVIPVALFIFVAVAGLSFSSDLLQGLSVIKSISNLLLVYLLVSGILEMENDARLQLKRSEEVLLAFVAGIYIIDLVALLRYLGIVGSGVHTLPLTAPGMHHIWLGNLNAIGLYSALSLVFFSSFFRNASLRAVLISFIAVSTLCILFSFSRTAWAGITGTTIILIYFIVKDKKMAFVMTALFLACGFVAYLSVNIVHTRIDQIFSDISLFLSNDKTTSLGGRFVMWKGAWKMFLSSPLWGIGTGDYGTTVLKYVRTGRLPEFILRYNQPHNMYFFAVVENGLIGLSALLYLFYRAATEARIMIRTQELRLYGFIAMAVSCHYMIGGLTESLFNIHVLICSFALIMGLTVRRSLALVADN